MRLAEARVPSLQPIDRRRERLTTVLLAVVLVALPLPRAGAQRGILVQGVADVELWATDSASPLLTRNGGRPGLVGRLQLWSAAEPWNGVVVFAQGELEMGNARTEPHTMDVYLNQAGLRLGRSRTAVLELGKMPDPVGAFAPRRFSDRNPLIGVPEGYPVQYPLGVALSGETEHADYRLAMVSLPLAHEGYTPEPTPRLRPAVSAGLTPMTGVHLGTSFTWGPYLSDELAPTLYAGRAWSAYHQRVLSVDAEVSRGYLETHAEFARSSDDVPSTVARLNGLTYYVEAKYTLSPRFFVATRFERDDYPFLLPVTSTSWMARLTNMYDGEAGIGYRLSASRLLKISYRGDDWRVDPAAAAFLRNGRAVAMQFSQTFDASDLINR